MVRPAQPPFWALFWRTALILKVAGTILGLSVSDAYGQTPVAQRPEFEVASVKPHSSSQGSPNVSIARDPGRLTYTNMTVRGLIREAYGLKVYPLSRGPDALLTDRYDVIAKVSPDASKEQRMLMLQALLAERFKLIVC